MHRVRVQCACGLVRVEHKRQLAVCAVQPQLRCSRSRGGLADALVAGRAEPAAVGAAHVRLGEGVRVAHVEEHDVVRAQPVVQLLRAQLGEGRHFSTSAPLPHSMASALEYPPHFNLPPFLTLQPVAATRVEQLAIWRRLILAFCREQRIVSLPLSSTSGPPFANEKIARSLDAPGRRAVADALIGAGEAEWVAGAQEERLLVWWRPLAQWADELSAHLRAVGSKVFTMAELKSADADGPLAGCQLHGLGADLVRAVVAELGRTGRATTFGARPAVAEDDDEVGVKLLL